MLLALVPAALVIDTLAYMLARWAWTHLED